LKLEDSSNEECNYPLDVNATTHSKTKASSSVAPEIDTRNPLSVQSVSAEPKILTAEPKKPPAFTYESKAAMPKAVQYMFRGILETTVPHIVLIIEGLK
jgi:hypothetical protein